MSNDSISQNPFDFDPLAALLECAEYTSLALNPDYAQKPNRTTPPEMIRVYAKRYRDRHPDRIRARGAIYRAKKPNSSQELAGELKRIRKGQTDKKGRLRCWWCGKIIRKEKYHVDHRIPLAKGGTSDSNNLVISCPVCNCQKHDKLPQDFCGRLF